MAQLVAHHTGSVGVRGSSPLSSTKKPQVRAFRGFLVNIVVNMGFGSGVKGGLDYRGNIGE